MKQVLLFVISTLLLQHCTTFHRIKSNRLVTKANLTKKDFYEEIPFTLTHGLPVVPVYIGQDTTPRRFYFDTGGYTVLSEALMGQATGVHPKSYIDVKDANHQTARIHTYLLDQFTVGSIPFQDVGFARIGFTEAAYFSCPGIDGTIGPNIMKTCIWYIDYDNQRVIVTNQLDKIPGIEKAARIPVKTNNIGKPLMEFTINGHTGRFTFDTGDNGFVTLQQPFAENLGRDYPSATRFGQKVQAGHSMKQEDVTLFKIDSIHLGEALLEDAVAVSRNSPAHSLGAGIFGQYNVVFNLGQDEVYFINRENPSVKAGLRSFGFSIDYKDQKLTVGAIYSNSPASKAGILPGDELAKINGKMHHFSDYCDFLNHFELEPAEEIQLELVRNGEPLKVKLRKEKIL
ncbi:MAG: aspartyl protease family protein [Lewinellaceae bacterium]|nr:aspartyl protease family protein [Lewinellaceae bacterium]